MLRRRRSGDRLRRGSDRLRRRSGVRLRLRRRVLTSRERSRCWLRCCSDAAREVSRRCGRSCGEREWAGRSLERERRPLERERRRRPPSLPSSPAERERECLWQRWQRARVGGS